MSIAPSDCDAAMLRPPLLPAAYVVERFGKYNRTLTPGLHILIPIVSAACPPAAAGLLVPPALQRCTGCNFC